MFHGAGLGVRRRAEKPGQALLNSKSYLDASPQTTSNPPPPPRSVVFTLTFHVSLDTRSTNLCLRVRQPSITLARRHAANGVNMGLFSRQRKLVSTAGSAARSSGGVVGQTAVPITANKGVAADFPAGVKVWRSPGAPTVDICFIHGLTGNRDTTWTAHGESDPWPKLLLAAKLPNARLLTYGYDAYVLRKRIVSSRNRLIDHAKNLLNDLTDNREVEDAVSRPLIFVVHSMGGLICKEAVQQSRDNPDLHRQDLFKSVKGIVFIGTPHQGSWMASWASIPASAVGLLKSTNKSLLEILQTENQLLESVHLKFLAMIRQLREEGREIEIICFFEELPLPVAGVVVTKESATLPPYDAQSIHANHSNMVKFSSAEDPGFTRVFASLRRWEAQAR